MKTKNKSKSKPKSTSKKEPESQNEWRLTGEEVRIANPVLYASLPVDESTVLYDKTYGCWTALSPEQLKIIRQRFGENCTLRDIPIELESHKIQFDGKGWPFVVDYAKRKLKDKAKEKKWSRIMSKQEIATALRLSSVYKLNELAEQGIYEVRQASKKRQDWQIRIDKLDKSIQKKLAT
jgi:hypothetical protein